MKTPQSRSLLTLLEIPSKAAPGGLPLSVRYAQVDGAAGPSLEGVIVVRKSDGGTLFAIMAPIPGGDYADGDALCGPSVSDVIGAGNMPAVFFALRDEAAFSAVAHNEVCRRKCAAGLLARSRAVQDAMSRLAGAPVVAIN